MKIKVNGREIPVVFAIGVGAAILGIIARDKESSRRSLLRLGAAGATFLSGCGGFMEPRRYGVREILLAAKDPLSGKPLFDIVSYTDARRPEGRGELLVLHNEGPYAFNPGQPNYLYMEVPGWQTPEDPENERTPNPLDLIAVRNEVDVTKVDYDPDSNPLHNDWVAKRDGLI